MQKTADIEKSSLQRTGLMKMLYSALFLALALVLPFLTG